MKHVIFLLGLSIVLFFSGCNAVRSSQPVDTGKVGQLTEKDRDGMVLFSLSMADAKRDKLPKSIKVFEENGKSFFVFFEHKLSCGTLMTGVVSESKEGDKIRQSAAFTVLQNPYEIVALELDATFEPKRAVMSLAGTMEVDDVEIILDGPALTLK